MRQRIAAMAAAALCAAAGWMPAAQAARPASRTLAWNASTGSHDGDGARARIAWNGEVHVEGAAWMRLFFADVQLGDSSWVVLHAPNGDQRLNAVTMREWSNGSAIFAGDRVGLDLHVGARDRGVSLRVESVMAGEPGPGIETACGADDRVSSTDNRVGRLFNMGCTAWAISNGAFLTAGHCADLDPDRGGPMLPDGTLDLTGVLEFRVPASQADGTLVPANANDQYPVDVTTVVWRFDGEGQGLGKDWAIFRVNRNANTLLLPWQAYGVPFRVTRELPLQDETVRVTGFGADTGTANQTNQTSTGPYRGETANGADIRLDHRVDTEGGNSGSPIIWESMNLTIGIHTNGGCNSDGSGANSGTSFEVDALENAINRFPGAGTVYADAYHPMRVAEEGTLFRPYATLQPAINATPNGGILSIYNGIYGLARGTRLSRPMTLQAPAGGVVILGN